MFVDACAIIAILGVEDTAADYRSALHTASDAFTSPLAAWEAVIVLSRSDFLACSFGEAHAVVMDWLAENGIGLRDPGRPEDVLAHAVAVAESHGLGKRGLSNFDCFHYAHAKAAGASLLTLDSLLRETDIEAVP